MKKAIISTISLALVFAAALSFASCEGDDDATAENTSTPTQTASSQATEKQTEKVTDRQTDAPDESEPAEDPATDVTVTDTPVTNAPVTNEPATTPETKAPAKDTTKTPETEAPVEDTTKAPETEAPVEDTTSPVTTKPEEDTTAPATTAPGQDPNVDYSQWGKHGFERLLPIPLPFSDEEADWISKQESSRSYKVTNDKKIRLDNPDDFPKIFKEYVESFEDYGYTVTFESYSYTAKLGKEQILKFDCGDGYINIRINYRT